MKKKENQKIRASRFLFVNRGCNALNNALLQIIFFGHKKRATYLKM